MSDFSKDDAIKTLEALLQSGYISQEEFNEKVRDLYDGDVNFSGNIESETSSNESVVHDGTGKKRKKKNPFLVFAICLVIYFVFCHIIVNCPFGLHIKIGQKSCTEDEYCIICGKKFWEHPGHDWETSEFGIYKVCKTCGEYVSLTTPKPIGLTSDQKAEAIAMAQEMVKAELKAPSTASFPWDSNAYTIKKDGNQYTVKGYVDAQNGFGAKVRSTFEACFTYEIVGTKYKIHKLYTLIY